jgi:nitroreductase
MTEPGFFDVVLGQRAHRELRPDPVPDAVIERVLEAATHAPSAENRQPWVFIVVRDEATRQAIGGFSAHAWDTAGREHSRATLTPPFLAAVEAWAMGGLAAAPVHIVVAGDTTLAPANLLPSSVFPAVQNLLLAAGAVGLGSLLSTLSLVAGRQFADLLALPDNLVPLALIPLGYPARTLGPARRIPVAAKTYRDRFGQPW